MLAEKNGRAFKYRLGTENGLLPKCPQLPPPEAIEREHVGTSSKSIVSLKLNCPAAGGQPTEVHHD